MKKQNKEFDCLEMKRAGSLRIYEETKDMTREQELAHWKAKNEEAHRRYPDMRVVNAPDDTNEQ